jgi:hypothetical protein
VNANVGDLHAQQKNAATADFRTDSSIRKRGDMAHLDGRDLQSADAWLDPTMATDSALHAPNANSANTNKDWDQFETNRRLFNVSSTYDENLYTKKLDYNALTPEQIARAERLAKEIEKQGTTNIHMLEERGHVIERDISEEALYSGVIRSDYQVNLAVPATGSNPRESGNWRQTSREKSGAAGGHHEEKAWTRGQDVNKKGGAAAASKQPHAQKGGEAAERGADRHGLPPAQIVTPAAVSAATANNANQNPLEQPTLSPAGNKSPIANFPYPKGLDVNSPTAQFPQFGSFGENVAPASNQNKGVILPGGAMSTLDGTTKPIPPLVQNTSVSDRTSPMEQVYEGGMNKSISQDDGDKKASSFTMKLNAGAKEWKPNANAQEWKPTTSFGSPAVPPPAPMPPHTPQQQPPQPPHHPHTPHSAHSQAPPQHPHSHPQLHTPYQQQQPHHQGTPQQHVPSLVNAAPMTPVLQTPVGVVPPPSQSPYENSPSMGGHRAHLSASSAAAVNAAAAMAAMKNSPNMQQPTSTMITGSPAMSSLPQSAMAMNAIPAMTIPQGPPPTLTTASPSTIPGVPGQYPGYPTTGAVAGQMDPATAAYYQQQQQQQYAMAMGMNGMNMPNQFMYDSPYGNPQMYAAANTGYYQQSAVPAGPAAAQGYGGYPAYPYAMMDAATLSYYSNLAVTNPQQYAQIYYSQLAQQQQAQQQAMMGGVSPQQQQQPHLMTPPQGGMPHQQSPQQSSQMPRNPK